CDRCRLRPRETNIAKDGRLGRAVRRSAPTKGDASHGPISQRRGANAEPEQGRLSGDLGISRAKYLDQEINSFYIELNCYPHETSHFLSSSVLLLHGRTRRSNRTNLLGLSRWRGWRANEADRR